MNGFKISGCTPVTLYGNMLKFRGSNNSFKLDGDLSEVLINYDVNVDHSNQQDRKLIYEFGKKMKFDIEQKG